MMMMMIIIIIFLDPGTSFPGRETLSKVCGVSNGYTGDSEVNCESVRQADCVETLDCHGEPLVQECRFTRVGSAHIIIIITRSI